MKIITVTLLSGILLSTGVSADQSHDTCSGPNWVGTPAMDNQGRLEATLESECKIETAHGSIGSLNHLILAGIPSHNEVHSGPTSETWNGLPSIFFDVTTSFAQGGDQISIREDLHIATDGTNHLSFVSQSKAINGNGNSAYLKVLDVAEDLTKDSEEGSAFDYKIVQTVQLEKPWYAPKDIFVSEAKKSLKKSFIATVKERVAELSRELDGTAFH